jgi:hypothetical protein
MLLGTRSPEGEQWDMTAEIWSSGRMEKTLVPVQRPSKHFPAEINN